jgi:endonuclease/exonuclease/phosphatase family metal-dependent hydrolase
MTKSVLTQLTLLLSLLITANTFAKTTADALESNLSDKKTLKVASWNIAWLSSHKYNERKQADYDKLAAYATKLNADVIALQEVESAEWAEKVFGDDYDFYFSTRDWVQRVGVAVKKSSGLKVISQEYKALNLDRVRSGMQVTLSRNNKEFTLLAVHLKSGCFTDPLDNKSVMAMADKTEKEGRHKEACTLLSQQIEPLEKWIDNQAAQNKAYLVLGDFNRRFSQDIAHKYAENQGLWQALNDEGQEALWTPTATLDSKCWGGYYKDYIDHIVFSPMAKTMYIDDSFEQLVFDEKYTSELSRNLSDHCPVSVQLDM